MSEQPPVYDAKSLTEADQQLKALFDKLAGEQLDRIDQGAKRIIELVTALLGMLVAVSALGEDFSPAYFDSNNGLAQVLALLSLFLYVTAMLAALWAVQPRPYKHYRHNLSAMREELDKLVAAKARALRWAGALFGAGSVALALLIAAAILSA